MLLRAVAVLPCYCCCCVVAVAVAVAVACTTAAVLMMMLVVGLAHLPPAPPQRAFAAAKAPEASEHRPDGAASCCSRRRRPASLWSSVACKQPLPTAARGTANFPSDVSEMCDWLSKNTRCKTIGYNNVADKLYTAGAKNKQSARQQRTVCL